MTEQTFTPAPAAAPFPPSPATEAPSMSEQLATEAGAAAPDEQAQVQEKPAGSPQIYPWGALTRRMRADFARVVFPLVDQIQAVDQQGAAAAAVMLELSAAAEEQLVKIAVDKPGFTSWAGSADDSEMIELLLWYVSTADMGKARQSSN